MRIASIRLKNFKNFRDACIDDIPRLCVIVGANGSGKSTLFDVFGFLKDCLTFNVRQALQARGGFNEVISRNVDPHESIEIELRFRMEIAGIERLVTYFLEIGLDERKPVVRREILRYKRGRYGSPFHFIDFANGSGSAVTNEEDFDKQDDALEREMQTVSRDALAIKGLGQFERFKAANSLRQLLENWHVSDFHINLARGSKDVIGESNHLSVTGDNLQLVARNLFENAPDVFRKIVSVMQHRVPGVSDVEPILTEDGRLVLRFQDESSTDPFIDRYVSDGTIKMFAYLVLLYDPDPHPLLCVEEPENQLYPTLLWELAEEFRAYAEQGGQVFVSTHSPDFLNATQLDEVYWLIREQGSTKIKRARDDEQIAAFMAEGDQMGYLWKEGFFRGAGPQ
ncbi:AAA family ATPase [Halochromatium glycolicum]|uniref:Chromosome segregation protein SMC n=1 Tax=Halochromatium glycolicum TaxID=85075 RepID=A0AAJ0X902_9GAMM|nr:AAA family ATPase [Halochromatium glycolicum]MBK1703728.1 chromosome segregation protein SMC [Halochromatium glycolicum]